MVLFAWKVESASDSEESEMSIVITLLRVDEKIVNCKNPFLDVIAVTSVGQVKRSWTTIGMNSTHVSINARDRVASDESSTTFLSRGQCKISVY